MKRLHWKNNRRRRLVWKALKMWLDAYYRGCISDSNWYELELNRLENRIQRNTEEFYKNRGE